jgi:hypothetical protein
MCLHLIATPKIYSPSEQLPKLYILVRKAQQEQEQEQESESELGDVKMGGTGAGLADQHV